MKLYEIVSNINSSDDIAESKFLQHISALLETNSSTVDYVNILKKYFPVTSDDATEASKEIIDYLVMRYRTGRASSMTNMVANNILALINKYHVKLDPQYRATLEKMTGLEPRANQGKLQRAAEDSIREGMYRPARYRVTMKDGTVKVIDWQYDEGLGQYFIDTYGEEPAKIERIKNIAGEPGGKTQDPQAQSSERADAARTAMSRAQASYERP
jgi:hypothetical protein